MARWLRLPGTWFFAASVASLLIGVATGPGGYVLAAVLGGLTAAGCLWPWLALRGLRCTLDFDRTALSEGESVQLRFRVENRWPIPAWGLNFASGMELGANDESSVATCTVALQAVGGWSTTEFTWDLRPELRGVYPRTPPTAGTGFPFALWFAVRPVRVARELLVWPREVPLADATPAAGERAAFQGAVNRRSGQEADVTGLRPYRRGDSLRQVHWQQTARQSTLIVRDRPGVSQPRIRIVVDLDPAIHWGQGVAASQEQVLRAARTLVARLHRGRSQLEVQLGWGEQSIWENRSGLRPILDAMARWSASSGDLPDRRVRAFPGMADRWVLITTSRRGDLSNRLPAALDRMVIPEFSAVPVEPPPVSRATCGVGGRQNGAGEPELSGSLEYGYESFAV